MVVEALRLLPEKIADFIVKHVWFIGSFEDGWAFTLRSDELKRGESVIFLSDELLTQSEFQIQHTILHEIGHVVLGHRNSIGKIQSKSEIKKQEKDADEFAKRYLHDYNHP